MEKQEPCSTLTPREMRRLRLELGNAKSAVEAAARALLSAKVSASSCRTVRWDRMGANCDRTATILAQVAVMVRELEAAAAAEETQG